MSENNNNKLFRKASRDLPNLPEMTTFVFASEKPSGELLEASETLPKHIGNTSETLRNTSETLRNASETLPNRVVWAGVGAEVGDSIRLNLIQHLA